MKKIYFYTLLLGLLAFTACEDEKSPVMELQKASAFEPVFEIGRASCREGV